MNCIICSILGKMLIKGFSVNTAIVSPLNNKTKYDYTLEIK